MTKRYVVVLVTLFLFSGPLSAVAAWPERPVQMIVPFPAGGIIDVVARLFAVSLSDKIGKPVVVIDRDGASGTIGTGVVAGSSDNYTVGFVPNGPLVVQPLLSRKVSYDTNAFKPICQIFSYTFVLAVPADSPINSVQDFLQTAQKSSKGLTIAFAGAGTAQHFVILEISRTSGATLVEVPYRGDPPVARALKAKDVDAAVLSLEVARPQGFKILAVTSEQRHPTLPDLPTLSEQGVNVVAKTYAGLVAPVTMSAEALQMLETGCSAVMKSAPFQEGLKKMNVMPDFLDRPQFEAAVRSDVEAKKLLVESSGLKVD